MAALGLPASPQLTAEEEEQLPAVSSTQQWALVPWTYLCLDLELVLNNMKMVIRAGQDREKTIPGVFGRICWAEGSFPGLLPVHTCELKS